MSYVYILTNEAMPGYIKIGMTAQSVETRMIQLDSTGVPLPFECYYAARVAEMGKVERALHEAFGDHRVRKSREFFQLDPYKAKVILELLAVEEVTPREEVVSELGDSEALAKARRVRGTFTFEKADIPLGATLTFSKGEGIEATVLDDRRILFRGEPTSLTTAALSIIHELGYRWKSLSGPEYWLYEGETVDDRRRRLEQPSEISIE